jgi:hypothetical protein
VQALLARPRTRMLSPLPWRGWSATSALAMLGGAAVVVGSWLPWMTLYAGLQPLSGLIGRNGRVLLIAGAFGMFLGLALLRRGEWRSLRLLSVGLGAAVSVAAVWLLVGVWQLTHPRGPGVMLVPRAGPGLIVVLLGGAMLFAAGLMPWGPRRAPPCDGASTSRREVH